MNYDFIKQRHYNLITKDEAKFIFEQAEKHLKDQVDTSQQIGAKTTTLLTVVSGLLIGVIGFGVNRWSTGFDSLVATSMIGSVYLYVIAHLLLKNIEPTLYKSVGLQPRTMFDDKLFNTENAQ